MATFFIASHQYTCNHFISCNRAYPSSSLHSILLQRRSTRPSLPQLGSSPWRTDSRKSRGNGLLARAEEKAKGSSFSSVEQQAKEKDDEEYQLNNVLRRIISGTNSEIRVGKSVFGCRASMQLSL